MADSRIGFIAEIMTSYHPRYRNHVRPYLLEVLRQLRVTSGETYGVTAGSITADIRSMLAVEGVTDPQLDRAEVNRGMIQSILNELHREGIVEYHTKDEMGWFSSTTHYYYKLTVAGFARLSKTPPSPTQPALQVFGDVHVGGAANISVSGDAFVETVQHMVQADDELRAMVDELRALNFHSQRLLGDRVQQVLEENAALKERVRSRGWSVVEFGMAVARMILGGA